MNSNRSDRLSSQSGVYVTLEELISLQYKTRELPDLRKRLSSGLPAGHNVSELRGRGLDFEELRDYRQGDDPRAIDWRVTQRTRRPHIRVYSEERGQPRIVIVDQRISMFFGTQFQMKSVTAAQIAAAMAWQTVQKGDRLGGIVFNDSSVELIQPSSKRDTIVSFLKQLADSNQALHAELPVKASSAALNQVLARLLKIARHDYTLFFVSDFEGADADTQRLLARLAAHNVVICACIFDPSANEQLLLNSLVVSDGETQVELGLNKPAIRERLYQLSSGRLESILAWRHSVGVDMLPVSSGADSLKQLFRLTGARP